MTAHADPGNVQLFHPLRKPAGGAAFDSHHGDQVVFSGGDPLLNFGRIVGCADLIDGQRTGDDKTRECCERPAG
jgi:hypothetical protein